MTASPARLLAELPTVRLAPPPAGDWCLDSLAGRVVELCGTVDSAVLTLVCGLVVDTQHDGQPVAWCTLPRSSFFPPDLAAGGGDLDAMPVIRARDSRTAARAAGRLLRSGAFGLVVLDLGPRAELDVAPLAHLAKLAHTHDATVVCLTEKSAEVDSLGSLVSLRAQVSRAPTDDDDTFRCTLRVLKDKRRGPGWSHTELCAGVPGLG